MKRLEMSWKHLPLKPAGEAGPTGSFIAYCVTHYTVFLSAFHCFLRQNNTWERTGWQKTYHKACLAFASVCLKTLWQPVSLKFMWNSRYSLCVFSADGRRKWQMAEEELTICLLTWLYCTGESLRAEDWKTIMITDQQMYRLTAANPARMLKSPQKRNKSDVTVSDSQIALDV